MILNSAVSSHLTGAWSIYLGSDWVSSDQGPGVTLMILLGLLDDFSNTDKDWARAVKGFYNSRLVWPFSHLYTAPCYVLHTCNVLYTAPLKCPTYCTLVMFPVLPPVVCRVSWPGKSCRSIWPSAPPDCPQSTETHCPLSANTAAVGPSLSSHPTSRGVISVAPLPSSSAFLHTRGSLGPVLGRKLFLAPETGNINLILFFESKNNSPFQL